MLLLNSKLAVREIDREGKLYSNVSRAVLQGEGVEIVLDYHSILLRISQGDVLQLRMVEGVDEGDCDYQMNGMVYKVEEVDGLTESWVSFGGLLMIQKGRTILKDRMKVTLSVTKI